MDINDKIITIYKEKAQVDNLIPGIVQIIKKENTEKQESFIYGYKIYDGEKWIEYYKTLENEGEEEEISYDENLSDFFSDNEDYIYFYVNRSSQNSPPINKVRKWNGDSWEDISSTRIGQILKIAADAEAIADGAIKTYSGDLTNKNTIAPNPNVGDLFIDVPNQNKLYRYNGSKWEPMDDKRLVGEGAGISFVPKDGIGASIIINQDMGLKITNNYGSYFQATADKIGFYDRDGNPKMSIGNDGNAVFSGTITAAKFVEGSELTSGTGVFEGRMYVDSQDGLLHLSNVTIDGDCTISGKMEVDLGGTVGGWVIGDNFLGSGSKDDASDSFIGLSPRGSGPEKNNIGTVFWAGENSTPNFCVDATGKMYANGAEISGNTNINTSGNFLVSINSNNYLQFLSGTLNGMNYGDFFLCNSIYSTGYYDSNGNWQSTRNDRFNYLSAGLNGIILTATDTEGQDKVDENGNTIQAKGFSKFSQIILNAPFIGLRGGGNVTGTDSVSQSINRIVISNKAPTSLGNSMEHILWFRTDNDENVPTAFKKINVYFK